MSTKQDKEFSLISLRVGPTMGTLTEHGSITTFDLQKLPSKRPSKSNGNEHESGKTTLQDNVARWN